MFLSYLWHPVGYGVRLVAVTGAVFILIALVYLFRVLNAVKGHFSAVPVFARRVGALSVAAFVLKSLLQTGTIISPLGRLVFNDRAVIIGFLHLVLLGFITLYILAHMLYTGILSHADRFTRIAVIVFAGGVIANEVVLMVQGFCDMLMIATSTYAGLLWGAAIWLLCGAMLMVIARLRYYKRQQELLSQRLKEIHPNFYIQSKSKKYESQRVY